MLLPGPLYSVSPGTAHAAGPTGLAATAVAQVPTDESTAPAEPAVATATGGTYVVQAGDTAFSIARRHMVSVDALVWANKLSDANVIREGQKLTIPTVTGKLHTIQEGDTVESIAGIFGVAPDALAGANEIAVDSALTPGERILVPLPLKPAPTVAPEPSTVVAAAEPSPIPLAAAQAEAPVPILPPGTTVLPGPDQQPSPAPSAGSAAAPASNTTPLASRTSLVPTAAPVVGAAASGPPTVTVTTARIKLAWPITLKPPYISITTEFSPQHRGLDIGAPVGTPIKAAAAGIVKTAEKGEGAYGWKVVIDHGDNVHTWYAHLGGFAVAEGDRVEVGQTIGSVGTTGLATGPHLHLELRVNNVPINPRLALP